MTKSTIFYDIPIFIYPGSPTVVIVPRAKDCVLYPTKTARNDQIDEF